jgi:hypothetical protein
MDTARELPLGEALRTVGLRLDVQQVRRARLEIDGQGIRVRVPDGERCYAYSWGEVAEHSRAQQRLRRGGDGISPWRDPKALARWVVLLRLVGDLLDAQGLRACAIEAAVASPDASNEIKVTVTANGREVVDEEAVQLHLLRLLLRHIDPREAPPPVPSAPPRWQFWRHAS